MRQLLVMTSLVVVLITGLAFPTAPGAEEHRARVPAEQVPATGVSLRDIYVRFKVKVLGLARIKGRFERLRGRIVSNADGRGRDVHMHIDADSVTTDHAGRDDYLRGPTFFAAEQHPHITFSGACLYGTEDGRWRIVGDLSLRGITRRVSFEVQALDAVESGGRTAYRATTTIRRSDFGLNTLSHIVSDEVEIIVAMNAGAGGA